MGEWPLGLLSSSCPQGQRCHELRLGTALPWMPGCHLSGPQQVPPRSRRTQTVLTKHAGDGRDSNGLDASSRRIDDCGKPPPATHRLCHPGAGIQAENRCRGAEAGQPPESPDIPAPPDDHGPKDLHGRLSRRGGVSRGLEEGHDSRVGAGQSGVHVLVSEPKVGGPAGQEGALRQYRGRRICPVECGIPWFLTPPKLSAVRPQAVLHTHLQDNQMADSGSFIRRN